MSSTNNLEEQLTLAPGEKQPSSEHEGRTGESKRMDRPASRVSDDLPAGADQRHADEASGQGTGSDKANGYADKEKLDGKDSSVGLEAKQHQSPTGDKINTAAKQAEESGDLKDANGTSEMYDSGFETTWSKLPVEVREHLTSREIVTIHHTMVTKSLDALRQAFIKTLCEVSGQPIDTTTVQKITTYMAHCVKGGMYTICEDGSVNIDAELFLDVASLVSHVVWQLLYR